MDNKVRQEIESKDLELVSGGLSDSRKAKLRDYVLDSVIEGKEIDTEMVSVSNNLNDVSLVSNLNNNMGAEK